MENVYVDLRRRMYAFFTDGFITSSISAYLGKFFGLYATDWKSVLVFSGIIWAVIPFYWAAFESSKWQASPGKMALGIKVTDLNGNRISFARASGRYFAKILSGLTLLVGYFMAAFTARKQALHDIIAGCLVVNK